MSSLDAAGVRASFFPFVENKKGGSCRDLLGKTSYRLFLQGVELGAQVVDVLLVHGLVAVDGTVSLDKVEHGHVSVSVEGAELLGTVLEYRDDDLELVDEHADVVLLDVPADGDSDARDAGSFVFLHDSLDFGEVLLTVRALGAKVVDEERALAEMAEEDSRIAHARKRETEVHLQLGARGILHDGYICHLRFGGELGQRKGGAQSQ